MTFYSKEDGHNIVRICAPMDYAMGKKYHDGILRFWFWDYDSDEGSHSLGIVEGQIVDLKLLDEVFEPSEFVTWSPDWNVQRDWDVYS